MYKIAHVHADHKFYQVLNRYDNKLFHNQLVITAEKTNINLDFQEKAVFFDPTLENINKIVEYLSDFDMVVFANLSPFNKTLLLKLPKKIKVLWWFFGHEFYTARLHLFLSNKTIKAVSDDVKIWKKENYKDVYRYYMFRLRQIRNFYIYSKRIDAILMYSKEEYCLIKKSLIFVPKLIIPPIGNSEELDFEYHQKENSFIHAHNRNINNNHLEILEIVKKSNNRNPFLMKMFLSYGKEQNYFKVVKENALELSNVDIITKFLDKEGFNQIYKEASAFVLNSYRQIALGNIFTAIRNNCKIYLNDKNVIKKWLTNQGLLIFSIEDFKRDYENNNLALTIEQARQNYLQFNNIIKKNTNNDFQNKIIKILQQTTKK